MRTRHPNFTIVVVLSLILLSLVSIGGASASGERASGLRLFTARLTGAEEVPTPVDTDTSGRILIHFNHDLTEGEFALTVRRGIRVTQAHIHCAEAGVNGPVVVFLAGFHAQGWDVNGLWVSNTTFTNANIVNTACGTTVAELVESIRQGRAYVNAHTVAHPAGEVRGQLKEVGH